MKKIKVCEARKERKKKYPQYTRILNTIQAIHLNKKLMFHNHIEFEF